MKISRKLLVAILAATLAFTTIGCSSKSAEEEKVEEKEDVKINDEDKKEDSKTEEEKDEDVDDTSSASVVDGETSATIVPEDLVQKYEPKGFTDSDKKKALFIVGDPRKDSVHYDMVYTAMKFFEDEGLEVEIRDLYDMKFDPVLTLDNFFYAKDGFGEAPEVLAKEQEFVSKADHIIFCYPNWHDTPNAIVKGYMETVFAKQFAYQDTDDGLEGLLKGKTMYTIMNAGFLGGGRGYIDDGVGIDDEAWNEYMGAFRVLDEDTADFWGVESRGRFVNDRSPSNNSEEYEKEIEELRNDLRDHLKKDFFK